MEDWTFLRLYLRLMQKRCNTELSCYSYDRHKMTTTFCSKAHIHCRFHNADQTSTSVSPWPSTFHCCRSRTTTRAQLTKHDELRWVPCRHCLVRCCRLHRRRVCRRSQRSPLLSTSSPDGGAARGDSPPSAVVQSLLEVDFGGDGCLEKLRKRKMTTTLRMRWSATVTSHHRHSLRRRRRRLRSRPRRSCRVGLELTRRQRRRKKWPRQNGVELVRRWVECRRLLIRSTTRTRERRTLEKSYRKNKSFGLLTDKRSHEERPYFESVWCCSGCFHGNLLKSCNWLATGNFINQFIKLLQSA